MRDNSLFRFARSLFVYALPVILASASYGENIDDRQIVGEFVKDLLHDRQAITSLDLKWSVRTNRYLKEPQIEGCEYQYHGWFDFDGPRFRVDLDTVCPNDPKLTGSARFAFADNRYLVVHGNDVAGDEIHADKKHLTDPSSITVFRLSTDMRLVGVLPERFFLLKNYTLDELMSRYTASREFKVVSASADTREIRIGKYTGIDCEVVYTVSNESGMPIKIVANSALSGQKNQLDCEWKWYEHASEAGRGAWLPRIMHSRTWEGEEVVVDEVLQVQSAIVGAQPTPDLFDWSSMKLPDGFVVVRQFDRSRRQTVQWDAKALNFVNWQPVPLVTETDAQSAGGGVVVRRVLIAVNMVVVVGLLAWIVLKRRRSPV